MTTVRFRSADLPEPLARRLRERLASAHRERPFSPANPREAMARVGAIAQEHGLVTTVYRGALDLSGAEVDHLWLAVRTTARGNRGYGGDGAAEQPPAASAGPFVVDQSFPLFDATFVEVLRRWVGGDADERELVAAAEAADVGARVLGLIPPGLRYLGAPVWSERH